MMLISLEGKTTSLFCLLLFITKNHDFPFPAPEAPFQRASQDRCYNELSNRVKQINHKEWWHSTGFVAQRKGNDGKSHGSAAKTPFEDPEPAETQSTSNEANRVDEDSKRKTSDNNHCSRDPDNPPVGFNRQMPYNQLPIMGTPFEMFPGQYQEMMMDHMINGGRFRSPYYGFSDFGSSRSENSFRPPATLPGSNDERTDFHPHRDGQTASSTGSSYIWMSMFVSMIRPEPLTDTRGFNDWMKKFAFYLEKMNLKDIIPNSFGETLRQPTKAESRHIEHVFNECVSPKYYPPWILKAMDEGLSMRVIIRTAFEKITTCGDNFDAIERLMSFRYDGKYDPRVYINKVKEAIDEWVGDGNTLVPMTKAKLLSRGLRGDFLSIHSQLCVGKIEPNINAVDKEILSIYSTKMELKGSDERTVKYSICRENDYVVKHVNYPQATRNPHSGRPLIERPSLSYKEAIAFNNDAQEKELFHKAYMKEIDQLTSMNAWDDDHSIRAREVPRNRIINSKFIFTTKRDGSKKCRFIARGDQQKPGTYMENLQSHTVHNHALMTCMALALDNDMFMTQFYISSAYLNAELKEELYIRAPPHLRMHDKVFRLRKSLYGLKQSGANWYATISQYLTEHTGVQEIKDWPCVFSGDGIIMCLFVDCMVVFTHTLKRSDKFLNELRKRFDTKLVNNGIPDADQMIYYDILGLEIEYKKGSFMKFGMKHSLTDKLPQLRVPLAEDNQYTRVPGQPGMMIDRESFEMNKIEYEKDVKWMQKVIGLASYVAQKYRFDILYYVNTLAQHTLYPSQQVKQLTRQLIQYLWSTKEKQLVWTKQENIKKNKLMAITGASQAGQIVFRSQQGYFINLNGKLIAGKSSKIKITCVSSTEAEIYGMSGAIPILRDLEGLIQELSGTPLEVSIGTDRQPTVALMTGDDDRKFRNRFFGTRARRLKDEIEDFQLTLDYIEPKRNVADVLTKPLSVKQFTELTKPFIM